MLFGISRHGALSASYAAGVSSGTPNSPSDPSSTPTLNVVESFIITRSSSSCVKTRFHMISRFKSQLIALPPCPLR